MAAIRRYFGVLLLLIAPLVIIELVLGALQYVNLTGKKDNNTPPIIWVMIISIFTPIAIGLIIFGWYAFRGEYDRLPHSSKEL